MTDLHLVLQCLQRVPLLHQLVKWHKLTEALRHGHDLRLPAQIQRQVQGFVQRQLPHTVQQGEGLLKSGTCYVSEDN